MASTSIDKSERRVLLIRPSALGDVARTVPALATLRRGMPRARIDWLVHEGFVDVVAHHPALDGVVAFPRRRFGAMWRNGRIAGEALTWARQLRRRHYDVAIDLQGLFRSGLFTWLTGARLRVGFANARELAHFAYNRRHFVDANRHTVDRMLALLESEGHRPQHDLRLYVGETDSQWRQDYLDRHGGADQPYAMLAPTTRWRCKCWPIDRFAEVACRLIKQFPVERVVVATAPEERSDVKPLADALGNRALFPTTTVGQMMALLNRTCLLICNDSAPLHVAVGFDRPIVAIFGPTDPDLVGPYRRPDTVVEPPAIDRTRQQSYRKDRNDQSLISQVTVDMVWQRVDDQMHRFPA